ncbi:MAG: LptF/LptG family permease, partial [Phycisphaerae bacterium]|nr:LptF/LptG family permease [Phycisphaerae bacterium]
IGSVLVRDVSQDEEQELRRGDWPIGQLVMPAGISQAAETIELKGVYRAPEDYTTDEKIIRDIRHLNDRDIPKLLGDIRAEMHGRIAYGLSCFLLVAIGAALGLIFRGGHIISAFTISVVPAAGVIVMLLMGKVMISNPDVPEINGILAIWGGIVGLFVATAAVYWSLMRR